MNKHEINKIQWKIDSSFRRVLFMHVACFWMCVLCCSSFVCTNMTIGCRLYPQNMSAGLVMSGQYAWSDAMRYFVRYDLPIFPSGSWYHLRVRLSGTVSRWSMIFCWNGFHCTSLYICVCACPQIQVPLRNCLRFDRDTTEYLLTAHHSYAFLM